MFYLSIEQTMKDAFTRFAGFGPSGKIMPVRTAYRPSGSKPFRQSKTSCRRLGGLVVCCERKVLFEETQCIPHRRAGAEDRRPCLRIVRAGRLPGRRIRNCCRWRFPRYADVRHQRGRHAGQRIGIGGVPVRSGCGRLRDRNVPIGSCWNARHIEGRRRHRGRGGGRPSRRRGGAACRRPGAYAGCACQQGRSTRARRRGRPDGLGRGRLERSSWANGRCASTRIWREARFRAMAPRSPRRLGKTAWTRASPRPSPTRSPRRASIASVAITPGAGWAIRRGEAGANPSTRTCRAWQGVMGTPSPWRMPTSTVRQPMRTGTRKRLRKCS